MSEHTDAINPSGPSNSEALVEPDWIRLRPDGSVSMRHEKCAALRLRKATRRVTQIYDNALVPVGLTITQYGVLVHARVHPNATVTQLADILFTDPTTLTRVLKPLVERGLLALTPAPDDRRVRQINLTPEGRVVLKDAYPRWLEAQHAMRARLGDDDMASLIGVLDQSLEKLADL